MHQPYIFELLFSEASSEPDANQDLETVETAAEELILDGTVPHRPQYTLRDRRLIVLLSMLLCMTIYSGVGIFGVLQFGAATKGDVLLNYDESDGLPSVMAGVMAFSVCVCLPINIFPFRELLENVLPVYGTPTTRSVSITTSILVVSAVFAAIDHDLGTVFDLTGATGCMFMCYLLPCMMLAKLEGSWRVASIVTVAIGYRSILPIDE